MEDCLKIVVTMPVRNEDWVLGLSLRAVLMWADEVVILDHASTDQTPDIIREVSAENPGRVIAFREDSPVWEEMAHRQKLLDAARQRGASHIAIVDADEVLSGNLLPYIHDYFEETGPHHLLQFPWLCCWRGISDFRNGDASPWSRAMVTTGFKDSPELHWKARDGYDFHHRHPMGRQMGPYAPVVRPEGGLMHLQFAGWNRLRAKQALYQMTEVLRWPERKPASELAAMYGQAVDESGLQTQPVPAEWWAPYASLLPLLKVNADSWQELRCRELVQQHGAQRFDGLNLFGVV